MRRFLVMSLLLVGAGCQGLHEHCRKGAADCSKTEPCVTEKKVCAPAPKAEAPKVAAPPPAPSMPAVAQDVFFMPVTSYVPYTRATPTGPLRMTMPQGVGSPNVAAPPASAPEERPNVAAPSPEEKLLIKKLLEVCEKQCERLDQLERCIKERNVSPPPPPVCPQPLFRRPFFNRCEPLFPRCEPTLQRCEPLAPCEPANMNSSMPPSGPPEVRPAVMTIQ